MPHWKSVEPPRKRGRPLTYEEKWMVYYAFESFERNKSDESVIVVEDPYAVTSSYTGVARTTVANIVKSVRKSGSVPQLSLPGNRNQMTAIPISTEARIREFVFERHREGAICNAKHIVALLKDEFALEIQDRTMRRHLARMGFVWSQTKNRLALYEKAAEFVNKDMTIFMRSEKIKGYPLINSITSFTWMKVSSITLMAPNFHGFQMEILWNDARVKVGVGVSFTHSWKKNC
jgi:transposase